MNIRAKIYGGKSVEEPLLRAKNPKGAKTDELDSVSVPRGESRRSNNRSADRHRLEQETVSLTHEGISHEAQLINLSGGGAMVSGAFKPMLWDRIDLHLGDHGTVECAVRWIRGDRIGLEFAHETQLDCSADEQAMLLREAIARSFPDMDFEKRPEPGRSDKDDGEQRRAARHPLIWSGVLHHDYQSTPIRVRNISATGAMIESSSPVRIGAEPLLEIGDSVSISATVEWLVGDQVGLRFHTPFDMSLLARSKPEVAPASWTRPAYLDRTDALDSPWDARWNRLTITELSEELEGFLKR